jgi:hypothetical protein
MANTGIPDWLSLAMLLCLLTLSPSACSLGEEETKTTLRAGWYANLAKNSLLTRINNYKPLLKTLLTDILNATTV